MASTRQEVLSLLTEHFTYTPLTLIDDIINTVNELVYRAVSAVETGLSNTPSTGLGFQKARAAASDTNPDTSILSQSEIDEHGESLYPEKRVEIEIGVHKLETLLEASVDKNFDKFEIYILRNILSVRDGLDKWVRLEHYKNFSFPLSLNPQALPTPEAALMLRKKLNATRRLNASLLAEQGRNEAFLSQLRGLLEPRPPPSVSDFTTSSTTGPESGLADCSPLSFLASSPALKALQMQESKAPGSKAVTPGVTHNSPLASEARALISQLPELRALLNVLRDAHVNKLSVPATGSSQRAEERRAYLEGAIRSGIGDTNSWDRDPGDTDNASRGIASTRGDVGAIESIASTLSRQAPDATYPEDINMNG